jgi:hypothetical protein
MSAAFQTMVLADAVNVFTGVSDFGEAVIYRDRYEALYAFTTNVLRHVPGSISGTAYGGTPGKPAPLLSVWCPYQPGPVNTTPDYPIRLFPKVGAMSASYRRWQLDRTFTHPASNGVVIGIPEPPDRGGCDAIYCPEVSGGPSAWHPVVEISLSTPGGWMVKCR